MDHWANKILLEVLPTKIFLQTHLFPETGTPGATQMRKMRGRYVGKSVDCQVLLAQMRA
jgi:hypothetical protein